MTQNHDSRVTWVMKKSHDSNHDSWVIKNHDSWVKAESWPPRKFNYASRKSRDSRLWNSHALLGHKIARKAEKVSHHKLQTDRNKPCFQASPLRVFCLHHSSHCRIYSGNILVTPSVIPRIRVGLVELVKAHISLSRTPDLTDPPVKSANPR